MPFPFRRAKPKPDIALRPDLANKVRRHPGYLSQFDLHPDVIIDVGVQDGTPWLYNSYPNVKYILIDPLTESREACAKWDGKINYDFHLCAVGEADGEAEITIPRFPNRIGYAMSSLHTRIDKFAKPFRRGEIRTVPVRRLDDIARATPGRIGLKIDTEGHELQVLRGAPETLARCDFAILEVSVSKRFQDLQPPSGIISLLAGHGLELRDVIDQPVKLTQDLAPRHLDLMFTRWMPD